MGSKSAEYSRERRARAKREGWCSGCGREDARTKSGKTYCAECAEKQMRWQKQRQAERRAAGVCILCGQTPREGHVLCQRCAERNRENFGERYARLKAAGMCISCGRNPASAGYVQCEECRGKYR